MMKKRIHLSVLFFYKNSRIDENGKSPLLVRITYDKKRAEFSTRRMIDVDRWCSKGQKLKGNSSTIKEFNQFLEDLKNRIHGSYLELLSGNSLITAESIKIKALNLDTPRQKGIIELCQFHLESIMEMENIDYAPGTIERYKTLKNHLMEFLRTNYAVNDIPLIELDYTFLTNFQRYLKLKRHNSHNTSTKYLKNLKSVLNFGHKHGWNHANPFLNMKLKLEIIDKDQLTMEEIDKILNLESEIFRINLVKDIFIFCCYTGLAYSDVKKLKWSDINIGIDGKKWINIHRTKTNTPVRIPILEIPMKILEKYKNHRVVLIKNIALPVPTNQKLNSYLKEIADLCHIQKNITMHMARHTFATTITLLNGMSMETVSKLLGHTKLSTTQHYSKVKEDKISLEMELISGKLSKSS